MSNPANPVHRVSGMRDRIALHDVAATRRIEAAALAGSEPHALMRRAGEATARLAVALAPHARRVWVAAGPGHNGGDGLVAATHLHRLGRDVRVQLLADESRLSADAADALARARAAGVPVGPDLAPHERVGLAIDALLGIGASRAPEGAIAAAVALFNGLPALRLAVDVPTGLAADTGHAPGACVQAHHTITFLTVKPGLFTAQGRDAAGTVWHAPLQVDAQSAPASAWLSGASDAAHAARRHTQHKGSFGDVTIVGGAAGMAGAARLAARAALAAGGGRVYLCPLDPSADAAIDPSRPELMHRALERALDPRALAGATVVCGCGGGEAVRDALDPVMHHAARLVLDADALNAIASERALRDRLRARSAHGRAERATVLTPHPLEAARLLGVGTRDVQADRLAHAQRLADDLRCVVLLKGSGSVIAAPGRTPHVNPTGNASLASPGTGDVLAGWLGGTWSASGADGLEGALRAALSAAWRHGAAADAAGVSPLRASDLIEAMLALGG